MRVISFVSDGRPGFGVITPKGVADLSGGRWTGLEQLLSEGPLDAVAVAASAQRHVPFDKVSYLPPLGASARIFCIGMAYRAHAAELQVRVPDHPSIFMRGRESFVGHDEPVLRSTLSTQFDFEAELGVIIGRGGRHIAATSALDHVAGYCCVAENSFRDYQQHNLQVTPGKNFDASGAVGPWIVTADEAGDPSTLTLTGRLNGAVMQRASVSDLIFSVPEIIAYISRFTALRPGDLISTGTPAGVGALRKPPVFMKAGDRFDVEIDGVGVLSNPVADDIPLETPF